MNHFRNPFLAAIVAAMWLYAPVVSAIPLLVFAGGSSTPAATYIINETFEGTGTAASWTDSGTGYDWDYTGTVLAGSQSYYNGTDGASYYVISDGAFFEVRAMMRIADATPGATVGLFGLRSAAGSTGAGMVRLLTNGKLAIFAAGSDGTGTTNSISDNTTVYIKFVFNKSGACTLEWNTTNSFSGSGTKYTTNTANSQSIGRFYIGSSTGIPTAMILDNLLVDDVAIP